MGQPTRKKRGRGRPTKYRPEYSDQLVEHMKAGLSFESFAGVIGVNRDTLYAWLEAREDFSDARKRGDAASLLWWEKMGKAAMLGQPLATPDGRMVNFDNFNATLWIFQMKNRHGWRDKVEHSGDQEKPIKVIIEDYSDGNSNSSDA